MSALTIISTSSGKEVLGVQPSLFFALLCCLFFVHFLKNNNRIFYILSMIFSLLSVLTKESGFVLPMMIVLLACLLHSKEKKCLPVLKVFLPYGVLIGLYFVFYQLLLKKLGGDYRLGKHSASTLIFYLPIRYDQYQNDYRNNRLVQKIIQISLFL